MLPTPTTKSYDAPRCRRTSSARATRRLWHSARGDRTVQPRRAYDATGAFAAHSKYPQERGRESYVQRDLSRGCCDVAPRRPRDGPPLDRQRSVASPPHAGRPIQGRSRSGRTDGSRAVRPRSWQLETAQGGPLAALALTLSTTGHTAPDTETPAWGRTFWNGGLRSGCS